MSRQDVIRALKRHEGLRLHVYQDHLGYWTIGYGRMVDARRGGGITEEEAEHLLENDVGRVEQSLDNQIPWWREQPEAVQDALVNMAFQMGVAGLMGFRQTLELIRNGAYDRAAEEALNSRWARQTPARAREVADWIRSAE